MKTLLNTLLLVILSFSYTFSNAAVVQISAPRDLYSYVNTLNDGDIIELTTAGGGYYWSGQVSVSLEKAITIRAKSGLASRPVVAFSANGGSFLRYNGLSAIVPTKTWNFVGIEFDGLNTNVPFYATNFFYSYVTAPNYGINVEVDNCVFKNFSGRTFQYAGTGTSTTSIAQGGDISVSNTEFRNVTSGVLTTSSVLLYNPNNTSFNNCFFEVSATYSGSTYYMDLARPSYNSYKIDHCTFTNSNRREINFSVPLSASYIRNSLFVNSSNINSNNIYAVTLGADCGIYYTGTALKTTIYPFSTATRTVNPLLNATGIATAATYLTGTTDGLPTGFYGNQISCSESEITNLSYSGGAGPSTAKSFSVSATRLTNNVKITPPASNFEISFSATTGFGSTPLILPQLLGNLASTTVYVRLKAGLSDNLYNSSIAITSAGAASKSINISGTVTSLPTIFISKTVLSGFTYIAFSGPSLQQSFTLNAAGLSAGVMITAPTGFEISQSSGSSFIGSPSQYILPIVGKITNLNIYVRMKASLDPASYSGSITLSSTAAVTKNIALSGSVSPAPVVLTVSKTSISNINYSFGNGPSTIQTFTVNGTGLTTDIKITVPANFEISRTTNTLFSGTNSISLVPVLGSVPITNIYLRLKKDLAVGIYNSDKVKIETTGIANKEINLSAYVAEGTSVSVSTTSLTVFSYDLTKGPSAEKSFDIMGVNLVSYVNIIAPANYELSTTTGAAFVGSGLLSLDPANINGQTYRIYVRLASDKPVGSYNGNISVASSGATTRTIALTGSVYNPLVVISDPAIYPPRLTGTLTLTNKWLFSKNLINYSLANELVAASGMARDMAVLNGKMLFADRGNKQIVVVNGVTGLKETPVSLNSSLFTYIGRNMANTADSTYIAGTYQNYALKVDNAGNVLLGNLITTNTGRYQIYKIDMSSGNGTLIIDQPNLATLYPLATTMRFDYFGVWGDVNTSAVIFAANSGASAMEVYKWTISAGIASAPSVIKLDNVTTGTYLSGLESLGGNAHVFPVAADKLYVDGGGTYATLVNTSGAVLDGFHRQPSALKDSVTVAGQSWIMDPGNNGVTEFQLGENYFLLTAASNTTGIPASTFRLFRFKDATKSFYQIDCMWSFPQAGLGVAANAYRTALPVVVANGNTAKIYVYCGENGFGVYELNLNTTVTKNTENPTGNELKVYGIGNEIRIEGVAKNAMVSVYNLMGMRIITLQSSGEHMRIPVSKGGVYLVRASTKTVKVAL